MSSPTKAYYLESHNNCVSDKKNVNSNFNKQKDRVLWMNEGTLRH